ncbi:MAG: MBOAT family protein [Synergistaceae bacterium]|nr:MBOAT family protein [Synergistaceae bacterium]
MLFNSWQYAIFFPVVFAIYWGLPEKFRWPVILVSSYYFYMSWNVKYVVLILFTTIISYLAALLIERYRENNSAKKFILAFTLIACLGVLFVFKYYNFALESFASLMSLFAIKLHPATLNLLLPVGISFYTFQTLGYVIDVYRGDTEPEKNLGIYAAFISFFPQLVAGPIERTNNLLPQIKAKHVFNYEQATYGIKLMTWGFFKKLAIADVLSRYVDEIYSNLSGATSFDLWLAIFFFTIQIYCDFSGYSDIARGCAKMMGINLMENFKSPYFSASIKEFWSRWHISLSTWFRDYLYIPLGGNRVNKFRHCINLLITFIISGLWHGANWTFVIWGFIHGLAQVIENFFSRPKDLSGIKWLIRVIITFIFVSLAWVFFRAENFNDAIYIFTHMFNGILKPASFLITGVGPSNRKLFLIIILIFILALYDFFSLKFDIINKVSSLKLFTRWIIYDLFIVFIFFVYTISAVSNTSFIYFQF